MSPIQPKSKTPVAAGSAPVSPQEPAAHGNFFQRRFAQDVLPFLTSLMFHMGMVAVGVALYYVGVKIIANNKPAKEPPTVADTKYEEEKQPGGVPNQGLNHDPLHEALMEEKSDVKTPGWSKKKGPAVDLTEAGGGAGNSRAALISVGPDSTFGHDVTLGSGTGPTGGPGSGEDGAQMPFGAPGGGAIGPKNPVFGDGSKVRRIAFVCDASGSMINKMATLKDQLSKTIVGLMPIQSFEIIFFQDEKFDSFIKYDHKDALVSATPQAKRNMSKFLEGVQTSGSTDPLPGIEAAFKTKPQLIYLLTDGDFPDNAAVLKLIRDLNKDQNPKIKINTIAFVGEGDNEVAFLDLLQTIAKETGGTFRHVKESDL